MNQLEHFTSGKQIGVDVGAIERDLAALWRQAAQGSTAVMRACSWNLVVLVEPGQSLERAKALADELVERVPSRTLVLRIEKGDEALDAWVTANCRLMPGGGKLLCSEEITVEAKGRGVEFLPSLTRALLVPDIPTAVLSPGVPDSSAFLTELTRLSDRLIVDSRHGELHDGGGDRMVDLAWLRSAGWRLAVAKAFDEQPERLKDVTRVEVTAPKAWKAEAELMRAWLALRLGRQVEVRGVEGDVLRVAVGQTVISWDGEVPQDSALLERALSPRSVDPTFQHIIEGSPLVRVSPVEGRSAFVTRFVESAKRAIAERGVFTCALTGGSAVKLYPLLAEQDLDWSRIDFFLGDERLVPLESEDSNYRAARQALPKGRIHVVRTELSPEAAAADYERLLPEELDLVHLGMGPDGHVASLFPGHPLLQERRRRVAAVTDSPKPPAQRVTFTRPVLENAREVWFLITGDPKKKALAEEARTNLQSPLPAAMVSRNARRSIWFFDL